MDGTSVGAGMSGLDLSRAKIPTENDNPTLNNEQAENWSG